MDNFRIPPAAIALGAAIVQLPFGRKAKGTLLSRGAALGLASASTFYEVSPEAVIGGNNDKHISYTVRFVVESSPSSTHGGVETQARSYSTLGSAYLAAIWPFHKLVVHRLLRNVQF